MPDSPGSPRWVTYLDHVDFPPQRFFEIEDKPAEVKDGPSWFQLDEEVDIAIRPRVSSGHGSKYANALCSVTRRNGEELVPSIAESGQRHRCRRRANGDPGPGEHVKLDPQRVC